MLTINGTHDLKSKVDEEVGASGWHEVTQERGNASATGDFQFVHVAPRARRKPRSAGPSPAAS